MESLDACAQVTLDPGEAIIIRTPTGGGFGILTIERTRDCSRALAYALPLLLRVALSARRPRATCSALGHELIELGLVARLAQTIEEGLKLLSLLLQTPQGLLAIGVEGRVTGRAERT